MCTGAGAGSGGGGGGGVLGRLMAASASARCPVVRNIVVS